MNEINFKDNLGLIHFQAKRGFKWASGAGLTLDYEDLFQEASLAFVVASRGFDPEHGGKFSTYYTMVAFSHFRNITGLMSGVKNLNETQRQEIADRHAENQRRAQAALAPLDNCNYGLRPINFSALKTDEETDFESSLAGDGRTPEEILEAKQIFENAFQKLSPLAQLVVEWLENPPPELVRELNAQRAYASKCVGDGHRSDTRCGTTFANVTDFLQMAANVSDGEVIAVKAELGRMVKRMEKEEAA